MRVEYKADRGRGVDADIQKSSMEWQTTSLPPTFSDAHFSARLKSFFDTTR